jgi:acetylornithine deacetylase/succinyl-diaminopimelate desuccinylase-like protein
VHVFPSAVRRTMRRPIVLPALALLLSVVAGVPAAAQDGASPEGAQAAWPVASGGRSVDSVLAATTPPGDSMGAETAARLAEYIRINTSNPPGNELQTARWLKDVLAREGIEGHIVDTAELGPGRANFYAVLKGDGTQKGIALVHHMDVVPVTRERWAADPFGGVIKDGYLWGRGTLDMKGQGIIQLMSFIALKRAGVHLTRDIVYIANADEEADGTGALTFVKRHADLLSTVEYLMTEGSDTRVENGKVKWWGVSVGEKRAYWQQLVVRGTASHGSEPTADNPVPRLARAIVRVAAWNTPLRVSPAVDRLFKVEALYEQGEHKRWLADAAHALQDPRGRVWLTSDPDRNALLRNTISPTVLHGAEVTNIIPGEATGNLDIRLLPDEDTAAFKTALTRIVDDPKVEIRTLPGLEPKFNAPINTALFHGIERAVHEMAPGLPVATTTDAGATDRPTYAGAGIICYGLSPYLVEMDIDRRGEHGDDERIPLNTLGWGVRFYEKLLTEMQAKGGI